ncbi:hypothetical protein JDO7802_01627 [Jannaschia donghaensis]|uniref:Uncharacterized protein n=1 Tax=Jannaschia donghaensis TaxID=420998 RepID=A0A0M6YJD9_9RHOB|nr:hypothetical protein JDO7802_01627 [Jannaschia donghaensis]
MMRVALLLCFAMPDHTDRRVLDLRTQSEAY